MNLWVHDRLKPKLSKISVIFSNSDKEKNLQYVQDYEPDNEEIQHVRILLYGPVGVGKSSFINSVSNVVRGRMTTPALTNAAEKSDISFTRKVRKLQKPKTALTNRYVRFKYTKKFMHLHTSTQTADPHLSHRRGAVLCPIYVSFSLSFFLFCLFDLILLWVLAPSS